MLPRILIVDDEKAVLFGMREYFTAYGYEVDCACNRQEAEALLAENSYAVLITDLRLTGSDDTEGLDIVRYALQRHPAIRSILLTAYGTPEIEESAYRHGIDICLSKPRPLDEIVETVSTLLEKGDRNLPG